MQQIKALFRYSVEKIMNIKTKTKIENKVFDVIK